MIRRLALAIGVLLMAACGTDSSDPVAAPISVAVVSSHPSGSHAVGGVLDVSREALSFQGPADPIWIVVAAGQNGPLVVVVDAEGGVSGFDVAADFAPLDLNLESLPEGTPPAVLQGAGGVLVLSPPSTSGSFLTHPLPLPDGGLVFVDEDGGLVVSGPAGNRRFDLDALPDARPVLSSDGRVAVLAGRTGEYGHAVLGDGMEASRIEVIDPATLESVVTIAAPAGEVFEGLAPMFGDLDSDGRDELIATASGPDTGARLVVYSASGTLVASGPPVGTGFRWRHQLAIGAFGPDGSIEIVDVRTPHIGGRLGFHRLDGDGLVAEVAPGDYRTHVLGSRNLDQALAVDVDGSGQLAMLVPTQNQRSIVIARHTLDGIDIETLVELPAQLATNIAGADIDGRAVMALATVDGTILLWR